MKIKNMFEDTPSSEGASKAPLFEPLPEFIEREPFNVSVVNPLPIGYGTTVFALRPRHNAEEIKARFLNMIGDNKNVRSDYVEAVRNTPAEILFSLQLFEVFNVSVGGCAVEKKVEHSVFKDSDKYTVESKVSNGTITSTVTRDKELDYTYSTREVQHKAFDMPKELHSSHLGGWAFGIFVAEEKDIMTNDEFLASTHVRFDADGTSTATASYINQCIKCGDFEGEPEKVTLKQTMWFPVWCARVTVDGKEYVSYISDEPNEAVALGGFSAVSAPVRRRNSGQLLVGALKRGTLVVKSFLAVCAVFMLMWMGEFTKEVNIGLIATIVINIVFAVLFHTSLDGKDEYEKSLIAGHRSLSKTLKVIFNALLSGAAIALFTAYFVMSI